MKHGDTRTVFEAEGKRSTLGLRFVVMCGLVLVVAAGIIGITLSLAAPEEPATPQVAAPAAPATAAPATPVPATLNATPTDDNPQPWQYDPVTNRHWVPGASHNHWHQGKPPTPWQYNPQTNQHFDPRPGHNHWHEGQPPPPEQRGAGTNTGQP